jgi:predicted Zn-dependent peptidase
MDHTAACFELLADLFLNATYPEDEMEREKGVICEEISMNEDTPEDLCLDVLANAYFGQENYGRNILGPASNVKGFTIDDVRRYKKARYCPENIVISFAGAIDFTTAQALVESYFGNLEKGCFEERKANVQLQHQKIARIKPIEQVHIALAYPAISRNDSRMDLFKAVNSVIGGSMSSRLFQEVREQRGLAYSVYSYLSFYPECGLQGIYAGVNPANQEQAYEAILDVLKNVKEKGITKDEFLRSREQMKASLFFGNESTNSQMLLYGVRMLNHNDLFDFEKKLSEINSMTYEMAQEAAKEMFDERYMAISTVGNNKPSFMN